MKQRFQFATEERKRKGNDDGTIIKEVDLEFLLFVVVVRL